MIIAHIKIQERRDENETSIILEYEQEIYCTLKSVTSIITKKMEAKIYFLSDAEIISDRWLKVKNLKLCRDLKENQYVMQCDCTYYVGGRFIKKETQESFSVNAEFLFGFPSHLF